MMYQDARKCPQCGGWLVISGDSNTQEEWENCDRCGYNTSFEIKKDEHDVPILNDKGFIIREHTVTPGNGVAFLMQADNKIGTVYAIDHEVDEATINAFMDDIANDEIDASKSYLTKWDADQQKIIPLYGEMPADYVESNPHTDEKEE